MSAWEETENGASGAAGDVLFLGMGGVTCCVDFEKIH